MLIAPHTRGLNQAARAAAKYLADIGVTLTHRQALDLVARTTGAPHHMAAQAALEARLVSHPRQAQPAGAPLTWAALREATLQMDDAQLSMPVMVSEGCDDSGNATFAGAQLLVQAQDPCVQAATGSFNGRQPLLLVEPAPSEEDKASATIEDLARVLSHPSLLPALWDQALPDAAFAALAQAVPHLSAQTLSQLPSDVLRGAGVEREVAHAASPQSLVPHGLTEFDLRRLRAQFEIGTGRPFDEAALLDRVQRLGLAAALLETEREHDVSLTLGPNLIFSKIERGYWSSGFGFVSDPESATGFGDDAAQHPPSLVNCPDATWVRFDQAPCIDD